MKDILHGVEHGNKDADTVILKGYANNPCHLHDEHILSYVDLN